LYRFPLKLVFIPLQYFNIVEKSIYIDYETISPV